MALTRKFLAALGIEADKVDEIIEAHTEVVNSLKQQRDDYKRDADKLPNVQQELEELKEASKSGDGYRAKYDTLQTEFEKYKSDQEAKEATAKIERAYRGLLKEVGVSDKRLDTVLKVSDLSAVKLDDTGNIVDSDKLKDSIKAEWSDFITNIGTQGAQTSTPPQNVGGKTMTKKDIMAIRDSEERQKAIAENHELFGF